MLFGDAFLGLFFEKFFEGIGFQVCRVPDHIFPGKGVGKQLSNIFNMLLQDFMKSIRETPVFDVIH